MHAHPLTSPPRLLLGDVEILSLCGGEFRLDAGSMFGLIPRPLWRRFAEPDEQDRLLLSCNCLLVRDGKETILVDTGIGERFDPKARQIYAVDPEVSLLGSLEQAGIAPEEVSWVIFTHLHFDHFCGALTGEELQPLFPNAVHCVQQGEWEDALAQRSIMRVTYRPWELEALQSQVEVRLLTGDVRLTSSFSTFVTGGHTEYHQSILVRSGDQTLVYPADIMPTRLHARPYWLTAYEMFPYQSLLEKRRILERAAQEDWIVAWNHDPGAPWSRLRKEEDQYVPVEI